MGRLRTNSQMNAMNTLAGKFIVLDGPDGAGKSEQHRLLAKTLEQAGIDVESCRDPGGTEIGDRIRKVLLDYDLSTMNVSCEAMLFMASRAQLIAERIRPALAAGKTVLCDRFVTSTCAYQGAAGYDPRRVVELANFAIDNCWPDVTVIIDVDAETGFARIGRKSHHAGKHRAKRVGESMLFEGSQPDAMEARSIEFHRKVHAMFLRVHEYYPTPVVTVDGNGDPETVHQRIMDALTGVSTG